MNQPNNAYNAFAFGKRLYRPNRSLGRLGGPPAHRSSIPDSLPGRIYRVYRFVCLATAQAPDDSLPIGRSSAPIDNKLLKTTRGQPGRRVFR